MELLMITHTGVEEAKNNPLFCQLLLPLSYLYLTFILCLSYLYLEVEILFCGVKFATQFIGSGLLTSQILTSILDH